MKRISTGLVAVLMAIGFAAFTVPKTPVHKNFSYTYQYTGTTVAGETNPANYVTAASPTNCSEFDDAMVCFIETSYAPNGSNHPNFSNGNNVRADANIEIKKWRAVP